jgi:hypothetical protein
VRTTAGDEDSARAEADQDEAPGAARRGDAVGIVTRSGGLQPLLPRLPPAPVGAEVEDGTVEIRTRRRGRHRHGRLPRRTRLLIAAVGAMVAVAGTSTVALMSDFGASVPPVAGHDRAEPGRPDMPSAGPFASADEAEQQMMSPDEHTALHRLAHAMPHQPRPTAVPTERARPTRSPDPMPSHRPTHEPDPTQDAEPRQEAEPEREGDATPPGRSKGAESRGDADRGRGSDARSGGAGRRG